MEVQAQQALAGTYHRMSGPELACLALAVYFEARSEPLRGQLAVAQVVLNRVESPHYPDTVCGVVREYKQFSFYWDGKSDTPYNARAWEQAKLVASAAADGTCIAELDGVTHYHADYVTTNWGYELVVKIGKHLFYRSAS